MLNNKEPDWEMFGRILDTLSDTAFCGLGCAVPVPLRSYVANVLSKMLESKIKLPGDNKKAICDYFK